MTQSQLAEQKDSEVMATLMQSDIDPLARQAIMAGIAMDIPTFMETFCFSATELASGNFNKGFVKS